MRIDPVPTSPAVLPPHTQTLEHVLGSDPAVVRGFARATQEKLATGPLSLRDRDRLIARGQRLGLKRFDANLIVATVERQQPQGLRITPHDTVEPDESPLPRWVRWSTVVAVQSAIVGAAWWFLR